MLWPLFVYYNQVHHTLPNIPSWLWCMACLVVRHCCHWQLSSKVALRPSLDCTYQLVSSGECHNNLKRKVLSFWFCLQPLGGGDQRVLLLVWLALRLLCQRHQGWAALTTPLAPRRPISHYSYYYCLLWYITQLYAPQLYSNASLGWHYFFPLICVLSCIV